MSAENITISVGGELAERIRRIAGTEDRAENDVVAVALGFYTSLDASTHVLLAKTSLRFGISEVADGFRRTLTRLQDQPPPEDGDPFAGMTEEEMDALADREVQEVRRIHRQEQAWRDAVRIQVAPGH